MLSRKVKIDLIKWLWKEYHVHTNLLENGRRIAVKSPTLKEERSKEQTSVVQWDPAFKKVNFSF